MIHVKRRQVIGLILAAGVLIGVGFFMPPLEGLSIAAQHSLAIVLCALCLWVTDCMPLPINSIVIIALIPIMGIMPPGQAYKEFISSVVFFVIATYGISTALLVTPLSERVTQYFLRLAGYKTQNIIFSLMCGTALLSSIMSNVPVTAMMMGISLRICQQMGAVPGKSKFGRTMMIAIPFAAMIGGLITPAGSSNNVLALGLLEQYTGESISFLKWMLMGTPIAIILLPIAWIVLIKMFQPEVIDRTIIDGMRDNKDIPKEITIGEKKSLIIIVLTIIAWLCSGWIPNVDMTIISIVSLIAFFLPGVNVFTWVEFNHNVGWDAVLTLGSATALGGIVVFSGLGEWMVNSIFRSGTVFPFALLVIIIAFIVNFMHLVLPIGPSIISILMPPVMALCQATGYSSSVIAVTIGMMASCCLLLPIDTVPLITYSKGYYSILDMLKSGLIVSCIWALLCSAYLPIFG